MNLDRFSRPGPFEVPRQCRLEEMMERATDAYHEMVDAALLRDDGEDEARGDQGNF